MSGVIHVTECPVLSDQVSLTFKSTKLNKHSRNKHVPFTIHQFNCLACRFMLSTPRERFMLSTYLLSLWVQISELHPESSHYDSISVITWEVFPSALTASTYDDDSVMTLGLHHKVEFPGPRSVVVSMLDNGFSLSLQEQMFSGS